MIRKIQSITEEYKEKALDLVETVFTDYENALERIKGIVSYVDYECLK